MGQGEGGERDCGPEMVYLQGELDRGGFLESCVMFWVILYSQFWSQGLTGLKFCPHQFLKPLGGI